MEFIYLKIQKRLNKYYFGFLNIIKTFCVFFQNIFDSKIKNKQIIKRCKKKILRLDIKWFKLKKLLRDIYLLKVSEDFFLEF